MQLNLPSAILQQMRYQFEIFDDFDWYVTAHRWTSLAADSGTSVAVGDARGGILALTTGATDNNEAAVRSTAEIFEFEAGLQFYAEACIQYSEANTDDANVAFGFSDAVGANLLVDDGAGPKTTFDGALIYKVDGGTVWRCRSSNGTAYTDSVSNATAGGSSYQRLAIHGVENDGVNFKLTYFLNGQPLLDSTFRRPIEHSVALASSTEMHLGVYVKAGGTNSEVVNVDWIYGCQRRIAS